MTIKTRFAPSPTGYLHIGGARTALFSWLYARRHGGRFVLRIEDTDLERSTVDSINAILEGMTWLGLDYDEGPFYQTHRFDRYKEVTDQLLREGKAYKCYCTKEELEAMREEQMAKKQKPRYTGRCRNLTAPPEGRSDYVVRFKNPTEGQVVIADLIRGRVVFNNTELDDLIIARTDGTPTYNFVVVVDDYDMGMTHVIRGDDHLNNTPRQMNIFRALGKEPPRYAHVPMILGEDGAKLSKRHGAASVMDYREQGFLPEALINYLVRLGWSHGDQEIFSLDEIVDLFDIEDVNNSASALNSSKLLWLNQHYIKTLPLEHVAHHLSYHMGKLGIDPATGPALTEVVEAYRERAKTLVEMAHGGIFFYREFENFEEGAAKKNLRPVVLEPLTALKEGLAALEPWSDEAIHQCVEQTAEAFELKLGKLAQPLRVAVTGAGVSPPIDVTVRLIGKERVVTRLERALQFIRNRAEEG